MWETNPNLKLDENGMDLCERYFYQVGLPMLEERFGDELDHIAAGLVGEGSGLTTLSPPTTTGAPASACG